jgi:hypothetical protein
VWLYSKSSPWELGRKGRQQREKAKFSSVTIIIITNATVTASDPIVFFRASPEVGLPTQDDHPAEAKGGRNAHQNDPIPV